MNRPESPLRTVGRTAAVAALFAGAACKQAAPDQTPKLFAPGGAPAPEEAGYREVVDVTGEVERLAKIALEGQVAGESVPALLTRNENRLFFVDHKLCGSPGPNGFALDSGRMEPHLDIFVIPPVLTHSATYVMQAAVARDCPDTNTGGGSTLDGDFIWNYAGTGEDDAYRRLRAIYAKLMAKLGVTVDPEPWNSQEGKDRAKEQGVGEGPRVTERAGEETKAKGK